MKQYEGPCLKHCYFRYSLLFIIIGILFGIILQKLIIKKNDNVKKNDNDKKK